MAICKECGKEFRKVNSIQPTCSYRCRDAARIRKRETEDSARCYSCGAWKPKSEFPIAGRRPGGALRPFSYCKVCAAARQVPESARKVAYRPAYRLSDEEKAANKKETNHRRYHERRALGALPPKATLKAMLVEQNGLCAYCGCEMDPPHLDHKLPVARGGGNNIENLHYACGRCNLTKSAMTHEEFLVSKKRPTRRR